ncbi:MAG: protecting protein DprA [Gammaproteobacteria bacterium]|jgi:DNA processing protein|nr:protecting protein DprA [Gammaproteobacteria bacterium]
MTARYWLALQRALGIGPAKSIALYEAVHDLSLLFSKKRSELLALGVPESAIEAIQNPDWDSIEADLTWAEQSGRVIITWQDSAYPKLLKQTAAPPMVLYVMGEISLLNSPQLAIVGSRNPTKIGAETAEQFAQYLAQAGVTITSGLAFGIDGASHRGALNANRDKVFIGKTIAVMGTGLNHIYPARHQALSEAILAQGGALVSEFAPNVKPRPENFPRRNRIISGVSLGVLVVEAALQSGSLITARYAMEQGREVFAIPGSIHNPLARGCHALLKQGAKLVETAQDIIEELGALYQASIQVVEPEYVVPELDSEYQFLLTCINYEPTTVDFIVARSGFTANVVSSMLLILELQGIISAVPGGYIRL